MEKIQAQVVSVHAGSNDDMSKQELPVIQVELAGIVGDEVPIEVYSPPAWLTRTANQ